jgi:molybdopterin molybdotransferase
MMETMISVEQAKEMIQGSVQQLNSCEVGLAAAVGRVLAKDIYAALDIPAYPQSSMDGYALSFDSLGSTLTLQGEMAAGSSNGMQVEAGKAVRIFTGAAVPPGADTVVVQEKSRVENRLLLIDEHPLKRNDNVRPIGSEIQKGTLALPAGTRLTPASIGFLAGMGISEVAVFDMPRVAILVTGNELCEPGTHLGYGQVYESNSFTLRAALAAMGIGVSATLHAKDDPTQLEAMLGKLLDENDMVLMTGGVSVGDYDFTMRAFENCGVAKIFHKIRQKPGKPILFGMKENKVVFGLPGNPASVLTCFYQYVWPALGRLMGTKLAITQALVPLAAGHNKPAGLTHFLKAEYDGSKVRLLTGQESYKLASFAQANCLAVLPETETTWAAGDLIQIHLLPY